AGSARVDLVTSTTVTLLDPSVHLLSTETFGLLGGGRSALLLGRSSVRLSGLFVFPGVIDSGFTGEIKIMVWMLFPPCAVPGGSRIAQLLFFSVSPTLPLHGYNKRGEGFGSTGAPEIWWTQQIAETHPICQCTLLYQGQRVLLSGIVDTGADVTVIS
ncbi:POK9 protein, partial [Rhagologus leucostigma]|nr:POK9 protein [Rhagologus leucostigma]